MKYTEESRITFHRADINRIARASAVLECMQDAANTQFEIYGPTSEELFEKGLAFILSRITIEYIKPIKLHEKVVTQTWPNDSHGYIFNRTFTVSNNGEIVARAQSAWALIDYNNHRIAKVSDIRLNVSNDEALPKDFCIRPYIPNPEKLAFLGTHTVMYSDADKNMHMNNTKYPDFICNYVMMKGRRMKRLSINFIGEAPLGDTVSAYGYFEGDTLYFRSIRGDGKQNIDAIAEFCDIETDLI